MAQPLRPDPTGPTYRLTTNRQQAETDPTLVLAKSYGQVIRDYRLHPEHKFNAPDGGPCRRGTTGMLQRRPVDTAEVRRIGKEANKLDDVQVGLVASLGDVLNDYGTGNSAFHRQVLPALDGYSGRQLAKLAGTDRRTIDRIRAGGTPRPKLLTRLLELASKVRGSDAGDGIGPR